ncbi:MAG: hypothetical protein KBD94_03120 [Pyrinomonadaceae bacterium]|nr:hypothetical protein [Pyrinomonadaceae bacterium]
MSKKFIIGHSEGTPVGDITIVNRTNRRRTLEYLSLTPAYDGADLLQPYWFTGLPKGITYVGPGKKRVISVFFTGRRKASKSYARRPWVNPGGHDGILKLRDKATGTIYEFNINIRAFQP